MKVGVIGGGIAGLAAAHRLASEGAQVSLFESWRELGGQAGTFPVGSTRVERAYHHLFSTDIHMVGLLQELGIADRLKWLPSRPGLFYEGRIYSLTPLDLLFRFRPLGYLDRIRLGFVMLYLQRKREWKHFEQITASEWISRYAGKRVFDVIWGPLLRGKYGDRMNEVAMVWFWNKVHLRGKSRSKGLQQELLGYIEGSWQVLIDALEHSIRNKGGETHTGARVSRVLHQEGRVKGLEVDTGDGARIETFDQVVATVPSYVFARLVPDMPEEYRRLLLGMSYQAVQCLTLITRRPLTDVYWLSIADRSMPFVGVIEHTNFIPPELYGGRHILYVSSYLPAEDRLYHLTKEELIAEYTPHLRKINPEWDPDWIEEALLFRDASGQPVITLDYSARIAPHRTPISGLYLANTTQIYPEDRGTNYSARIGDLVARLMLEDARSKG